MREYTDPSVFAGIAAGADWADPTMSPEEIDWPARQAAAAVPFEVVDGRPVIPGPPTGITRGRGELGHWGEMQCADAIVLATQSSGRRWVLLIERGDGHGWAVPGGKLDTGDASALAGAIRELQEETGLSLPGATWRTLPPRLVPDPRASDEAWMVTTPAVAELHDVGELPTVLGADDARLALWFPAGTYAELEAQVQRVHGGQVFTAHQAMLADILG